MIEDLLYKIGSTADVAAAEAAIARLPAKYSVILDLHYGWGLSRREIASMLGWSSSTVSQRLTRGTTLVKYELNPEAFTRAGQILQPLRGSK